VDLPPRVRMAEDGNGATRDNPSRTLMDRFLGVKEPFPGKPAATAERRTGSQSGCTVSPSPRSDKGIVRMSLPVKAYLM
jgi:hypothetical protein